MHKKLIVDAFEKAKENEATRGIKNSSKNHTSKILSDFIKDEMSVLRVLRFAMPTNYYCV